MDGSGREEFFDELISLVDKHKFWRNGFRVNLDKDENHRRVDKKRKDVAKVSLRAAQQYGARGANPGVRTDDAAARKLRLPEQKGGHEPSDAAA